MNSWLASIACPVIIFFSSLNVLVVVVLTPIQSHTVNHLTAVRALSLDHSIPNKIKAATLDKQCFTLWTISMVIGMIRNITYINIFQPGFLPHIPGAFKS